jgi:hypothetical protein
MVKKFTYFYRTKLVINVYTKFYHKSETNSVHILSSPFLDPFSCKVRNVPGPSQWPSQFILPDQKVWDICSVRCQISFPSQLVWSVDYTRRKLQCLKFLIMKTRTFYYYLFPLRSKYCKRRLWKYSIFNLKNTVLLLHKSRVHIIVILFSISNTRREYESFWTELRTKVAWIPFGLNSVVNTFFYFGFA